ncbi:cation/H(+) antiporter 15-like isoform X2 [Diospyros lotus]|nr:cation/H(+) antiporter 15-like isoform X2 [Diospyros lotus]
MSFLEVFSLTVIAFVVGIRTDVNVIKTSGKLSWIIGAMCFVLPVTFAHAGAHFIVKSDNPSAEYLLWLSLILSSTSFQVTSFLLEDLGILNSEIGRLAMSSSLISSVSSWVFIIYCTFVRFSKSQGFKTMDYVKSETARAFTILVIVFVLPPFLFWLMKKNPEGRSIKEHHFFTVFALFLGVAIGCEFMGDTCYFGAMLFGLVVPSGPPLGSGVVEKLEFLVSAVLVPAYIVDAGRFVDLSTITATNFCLTEVIIIFVYLGKFSASIIPSLLWNMPCKDSFALGFVLSSQGFYDVLFFKLHLRFKMISPELYSIIILLILTYSAIVTPIIHHLYDPSKRYLNYQRRSIQQSGHDSEFRVVFCIHEEDHVFSLLNLMRASQFAKQKPIGAFVLELMELVGRDHPLLINHQFHKRRSSVVTRTDRMISAFRYHELHSGGMIKHQYFTAITPYSTMHDDICTLALEKNACLLVIPFCKSQGIGMRGVTKNVLDKAPCSVGLLVDKKIIMPQRSDYKNAAKIWVCVVFAGGPDSREALAYGTFMARNPAVRLTVIRLIAEDNFITDLLDARLDANVMEEFWNLNKDNTCVEYREVTVRDGAETSRVLLSLNDPYDFMLTGRRLDSDCPLVAGLADWGYVEEMGIIGDILASSDMKIDASVLILQQQSTVEDLMNK